MTYVFDNTIDFNKEINDSDDEIDMNNICLISKEPLTDNYITLDCNHKFNYQPLVNECKTQILYNKSYLEINKIKTGTIKCPYCRTINKQKIIYNNNYNNDFCSFFMKRLKDVKSVNRCQAILKSGKNKGELCNCVIKQNDAIYCLRHINLKNNTI